MNNVKLRVINCGFLKLLVCLLLSVSVGGLYGQESVSDMLPVEYVGKSVKTVLKYLKKELDMQFAFDATLVKSVNCEEAYLYNNKEELLSKILEPHKLSFRKTGNIYLILPVEQILKTLETGEIGKTNFSLSGRVVDKNTGEPLPYAFLRFKKTPIWTESNVQGYFHFENVPNDTLLLAVNYLGYNLFLERLNQVDIANLKIELLVHGSSLSQVDIITNKLDAISLDEQGDFHKIDPNQIDLVSGNGQPDLFKSLQLMSGVQTEGANSSAIRIRNSLESENLILMDGIPLYHLSHFFGIYSTINPDVVKSVRLFKSTFSAEHGDRVGGIVDVTGKDGSQKKVQVNLNINLISAGFLVELPLVKNKTTISFAARQSHINQLESGLYKNLLNINFNESSDRNEFAENFKIEDNAELSFSDVNFKIKHSFNEKIELEAILFTASDSYENKLLKSRNGVNVGQSFETSSFDDSGWNSLGFGINLSSQWSDNFHSMLSINSSQFKSNYTYVDVQNEMLFEDVVSIRQFEGRDKNRLEDIGWAIKSELDADDRHRLIFGVEQRFLRNENEEEREFIGDSVERINGINKNNASVFSLHFGDAITFNQGMELYGGIRLNYNNALKKTFFSPRMNFRIPLNEFWTVKIAAGNYNQFLRKIDSESLALNQPEEWRVSDENIPGIESNQISSAIFYANDNWQIKAEGYMKWNNGTVINRIEDSLQTVSVLNENDLLVGRTEIKGIDITIIRNYNRHSTWLAYSLSTSLNFFKEINNGNAFSAKSNRLHDFKINYQYRIKSWSIFSSFVYATGAPYTPLLGTFTNDLTGDQFIVFGDDFSARLPDYTRFDVGVKYNLSIKDDFLRLGAGVYNLFGKRNISRRSYDVSFGGNGDSNLIVDIRDLELLGISPNFSISYFIK